VFFIRSAAERDLETVSNLLDVTWHATYDSIFGVEQVNQMTAAWHSVPALKMRHARPDSEFLVADDGKRLGGMAYAAKSRRHKGRILLYQLYILPEFQRQGIGRDMFAELETCFPDASSMRLEVIAANDKAISFYKHLGFAFVEDENPDVSEKPGVSVLLMEKKLTF
jgi:ribosomal protein S18 acetylase RimI-like enzyme